VYPGVGHGFALARQSEVADSSQGAVIRFFRAQSG
jgi:hypothetical protein